MFATYAFDVCANLPTEILLSMKQKMGLLLMKPIGCRTTVPG